MITGVKDVDFGFMFPALPAEDPPPSAPSPAPVNPNSLSIAPPNPATPQPEAPPPPSSQTPATASRSRGRPSNVLGIQSANVPRSSTGNDANTSAKRRKLETDEPPSSSTRSMRSSVRQDIYAIPDDDEAPPQASFGKSNLMISQEVSTIAAQISTPVPLVEEALAEPIETLAEAEGSNEVEVGEPAEEAQPISGALDVGEPSKDDTAVAVEPRKARKPAGRPPRNKRKRDEPVAELIAKPVAETTAENHSSTSEVDPLSTSNDKSEDAPAQELRRSRRRSSDQIEQTDKDKQDIEGVEEQAEAIGDHEAATRLNKYRGRRVSRNVVTSDSPVAEDEHPVMSPVVRKKGRPRQVISPVRQRQPAPPKAKSQKAEKTDKAEKPEKASRKRKVREGSPIPVMVHRLTSGPVYDEDDSDADILNSEIPCAKRAGVNSVDVLSQICQELVTAGLETLGENMIKTQDAALKLEYKTKMKAVENFTRELNVRLLEHVSISL
jgi:hypothetical protein